jgi:Ca2+-binding EF-hand superfamily protein/RNA polymerase subunit RPABC4/transcription elongation factor Spt4
LPFFVVNIGGNVSEEEKQSIGMAECGACRAIIPIDSEVCPECGTSFSGVSEDALGECGACKALVPLDSTRCSECGVLFVADDVVDILRQWVADTGVNIRKLFEKFDENNDGTIDSQELKRGLLSLNLADLPPSQVDRLVEEIDADGNGVIDLDEFDKILSGEETVDGSEQEESVEHSETDEDVDDEGVVGPPSIEITSDNSSIEEDEEDDSEEVDVEDSSVEEDIDNEDFDLEDDDDDEEASDDAQGDEGQEEVSTFNKHPLAALAEMMDEHEISAQRMFNELDADGNGMISLNELRTMLEEKYGDVLEIDDVEAIMEGVDDDGDGMIDITEFIESMEDLEDHEEAVETHDQDKEFPSVWQKRMMSKSWNDNLWPIIHVGFGILIALVLVNALVGPVDGSGGPIAYVPIDGGVVPSGLEAGEIYPCDEKYQEGGCSNSLTPFGGENGATSMPKGFYADGVMLLILAIGGIIASLFLHLIKAPEWRARVKAMKEFEDDKSDASETTDEDDGDEDDDDDHDDDDDDDHDDDDDEDDDDHDDDGDDDDDDDDIDIGSHIGLTFDDEEVFGKIIEFDDDEGTVTIEEDGSGDHITGYQEDMFIE